jgi:hypothetical protein
MSPSSGSDDDRELASNNLTEKDFVALAVESFRALDDEESQRADHAQLMADLQASAQDEAAGRLRDADEVMSELAENFGLTPWKRIQGTLANEPIFDEWRQAIEDYRCQRTEETQGQPND